MPRIEQYRGFHIGHAVGPCWKESQSHFGQYWVCADDSGVMYLNDKGEKQRGAHWFEDCTEAYRAVDRHFVDRQDSRVDSRLDKSTPLLDDDGVPIIPLVEHKYKLTVHLLNKNTITSETSDRNAALKIGQAIDREYSKRFWQKKIPTFSITSNDSEVYFRLDAVISIQIEEVK